MAKKILIFATILIASVITIHGCYTIIKHPSLLEADQTQTGDGEYDHSQSDRNCVSCHQDYHQYPYGYYYSYYPDFYWSYPRFGEYYAYPWWWNYYYEGGYGNGGQGNGGVATQGTKPPMRRGMEPPYARDTVPLAPYSPPSGFNTGGQTPTVTTPGTGTGGTGTIPPEQPKEKKTENKKPPTRRGGN